MPPDTSRPPHSTDESSEAYPHMNSPEEQPRVVKRSRVACDACRRRKTRCSGDRPRCDFCSRSGQDCTWTADGLTDPKPIENTTVEGSRLDKLQGTVDEILNLVRVQDCSGFNNIRSPILSRTSAASNFILRAEAAAALELYDTFCYCQPLPLITKPQLWVAYDKGHDELIHAVIALTAPFENSSSSQKAQFHQDAARARFMQRLAEGTIELATIQAIIISGYINLTYGSTYRAQVDFDLATSLFRTVGISSINSACPSSPTSPDNSSGINCYWSLVILSCLIASGPDHRLTHGSSTPNIPYPQSPAYLPLALAITSNNQLGPHLNFVAQASSSMDDAGILSYAIQSQELLAMAINYGVNSLDKERPPPWVEGSDYSAVMACALTFESNVHSGHRFITTRFAERPLHELEANRDYWGPWLLMQFAYHTAYCLLNHPVLLSVRLKNFQGIIPQSFIETSLNHVRLHVDWIVHFAQMISRKRYRVSDPFLAYCVCIAGTVSLQHHRTDMSEVRERAKREYSICLNWLMGVSSMWPNIGNIIKRIRSLELELSTESPDSPAVGGGGGDYLLKIEVLVQLINYRTASESSDALRQLFGPDLQSFVRLSHAPAERGDGLSNTMMEQHLGQEGQSLRHEFGNNETTRNDGLTPTLFSISPDSIFIAPTSCPL
ncbi:hypothetical protein BX600DRAFT_555452 [Xylariales sp. PMI_506]|nr:hypothetical protein BX600DRAFT_555452 [Xylariales sp. PMI_506]